MDIFERINKDEGGPLGQYRARGHGYFTFPKLEGEIAPRMRFNGHEGLAYPMGSRMMSGQTALHERLERELAEFEQKEDAFLFNFGYQGIVSTIDALLTRHDVIVYDSEAHACLIDGCALLTRHDVIVYDSEAHACLIDGCRLHMGKRMVYPHNDIEKCERTIQRALKVCEETGGGVLLITEGVYGMTGALGILDQIVALKKKYNFRILIDDAHGFGVMGPHGRGTSEHFGVMDGIDLYIGAYAKSMAIIGGFVAGPKSIINYLRYNLRSQIYAKSLPMPIVEGCLKRLEIIRGPEGDRLREKLWTVTRALQNGFRERGFDIGLAQACVTPVFIHGTVPQATNMLVDLRENYNLFCSVVVYPVVPKGVIMFRIIPTAAHSLEDVEYTLNAFSEAKKKLDAGEYDGDNIQDRAIN